MARLDYQKIAPEGFLSIRNTLAFVAKSKFPKNLLNLVYLRIAQVNTCPYYIDQYWQDATKEGEDARKLNALASWQETPFFSSKERIALAWAEAVSLMVDQGMLEELFTQAREHFSEKELTVLTVGIAQMNALTRIANAFQSKPEA